MAGENVITYNSIDSNKLMNKAGVLELSAKIKAYVDANAGGGGASLPSDPVNNGTYILVNTVSSGTATQTWESVVIGGSY